MVDEKFRTLPPKPRPQARGEEQAWFDAARGHRLIYVRCDHCSHVASYLRAVCPVCASEDVAVHDAAGTGTVVSFTTHHRAGSPAFADDVPYTLVLADMDEGFRLLANLVSEPQSTPPDAGEEPVRVGDSVAVVFDDVDDGLTLPRLRRAERAS